MEQVKVICIPDARHRAKQTPLPEETGPYKRRFWDAPQVGAVEARAEEQRRGAEDDGEEVPRVGVVC